MSTAPGKISYGVSENAIKVMDESVAVVEDLLGFGTLLARKINTLQTYNELAQKISLSHQLKDLHRLLGATESSIKNDARWMIKYSRLSRNLLTAESRLDTARAKILMYINERLAEFMPRTKVALLDNRVRESTTKLINGWGKIAESLLSQTVSKYRYWRLRRRILDFLNWLILGVGVVGVGFELLSEYLKKTIEEYFPAWFSFLQHHLPRASSHMGITVATTSILIILVILHQKYLHPWLEKQLLMAQRKDFFLSLDQIYVNHMKILMQVALMENSIWGFVVKEKNGDE